MRRYQQGIGLPEIMISLLLASLIMTALMRHYMSTKQHYLHLSEALDEASNLQLAADFMRDSIRQAGFTPCMRIDHLNESYRPIDVSDGLQINRMSARFDVLSQASNTIHVLVTHAKINQLLVISDCNHAEIQRVKSITQTSNGQFVTFDTPLVFNYQPPIYVGEWIVERFFTRKEGGLFYQSNHTDELTSSVSTMLLHVKKSPIGLLLQVELALRSGRIVQLDTRVRAA